MCGRTLDVGLDASLGDFFAKGNAQIVAARFVYIVGLGVSCFAATVDHIVELFAVGSIKDTWEVLCGRSVVSVEFFFVTYFLNIFFFKNFFILSGFETPQ